MLDTSSSMPYTPEQITAGWLEGALRTSTGNQRLRVEGIEIDDIIWGTATKVLVGVTLAADSSGTLPSSLCIKGGFEEAMNSARSPIALTMEAEFYGDILERLTLNTPRALYAGVSDNRDQGIIVLEDLRGHDVHFCQPGDALSVQEVAAGLNELAALHGSTWGIREEDFPGLRDRSVTRGAIRRFLTDEYWDAHLGKEGAPEVPASMRDPEMLLRTYQKLWSTSETAAHSLQHGDAHVGNTVRRGGQIAFIDWQSYYRGSWASDVAYFISGALTVDDRRRTETELLQHYLRALTDSGGPEISLAEAWTAYVRHLFHGVIWAFAPESMQPLELSRAMSERHFTAIEDHDVIAAVCKS